MTVDLVRDVHCCWDFDHLTPTGLLRDFGPHELHATSAVGFSQPTRQLDGSYYFDGADYFYLTGVVQARYYALAPTGPQTWIAWFEQLGAAAPFWSTFNIVGGLNYGQMIYCVASAAANGFRFYHLQGGAPQPWLWMTPNMPQNGVYAVTVETTPRGQQNGADAAPTWIIGAYGACVYDATVAPWIGGSPLIGNFVGRFRYLSQLNRVLTNDELLWYSGELLDGRKPFCWGSP